MLESIDSSSIINKGEESLIKQKILHLFLENNTSENGWQSAAKEVRVIIFLVTVYCFKLFYTIKTCFLL